MLEFISSKQALFRIRTEYRSQISKDLEVKYTLASDSFTALWLQMGNAL